MLSQGAPCAKYNGAVVELSCLSLRVGLSGDVEPRAEIPMVGVSFLNIKAALLMLCGCQAVGTLDSSLTLSAARPEYWFPLNPLELRQDTEVVKPVVYNNNTLRYSGTCRGIF